MKHSLFFALAILLALCVLETGCRVKRRTRIIGAAATPAEKSDLVLVDVIRNGEAFTVTVRNDGPGASQPYNVRLTLDGTTKLRELPSLAVNETRVLDPITLSIPKTCLSGECEVCAVVDSNANDTETNETNNQLCVPVEFPDLVAANLDYRPDTCNGECFDQVQFDVTNVGGAPAGASVAQAVFETPDGPLVETRDVPPLGVGETFFIEISVSSTGRENVCITVDANAVVVESNEDNTICNEAPVTTVLAVDFEGGVPANVDVGGGALTPSQGYAPLGPPGNQFGETFLRGPTGNTITITFTDLPPHTSLSVDFLMAAIDSLDGTGSFPAGDFFRIDLDGQTIFRESFANATPDQIQSYVPPPGVELARRVDLGFTGPGGFYTDSAYDMSQDPAFDDFPHQGPTAVLTFTLEGGGVQDINDESWAIDNLRVTTGNTPRPR